MSKILEQSRSSQEKFNKSCNHTKLTFRGKPLNFRNIHHQYSYSYANSKDNHSPSPQNATQRIPSDCPDKTTSPALDHTCSTFMRNYIDKLKKQRKREKKKVDSANHPKLNDISFAANLASLPSIPHGKTKPLVLKQIHPLTFRSNSQHQTPENNAPNAEQLISMLKEIKQHEKPQHRRHFSQGLPTLSLRKGRKQQCIEVLDPWENTADYPQSAFEQYK